MCVKAPDLYKGVVLSCPFFDLQKGDKSKVRQAMPLAKLVQKVLPKFKVNVKGAKKTPKWCANWFDDPEYEGGYLTADTVVKADKLIQ